MSFLFAYLLLVNAIGALFMCLDKHYAKKHLRRIPEKTLFIIAAIGGSVGILVGMYVFRHKTKHLTFSIGVPVIIAAQLLLGFLLKGVC